jgi:type IV pilus assembly protein PilB
MREADVLSAVGNQIGAPYVPLRDKVIPRDVVALVPEKVVRSRKVLPLARLSEHRRGPLVVACPDPSDLRVLDELSFATGLEIRPMLSSEEELERAIESHLQGGHGAQSPHAIDLPEDTSPLRGVRVMGDGFSRTLVN